MNDRNSEIANVLTHGLGVVAATVLVPVLIFRAVTTGDAGDVVGVAVFGATLICLYLASTCYHAARRAEVKARLKVLDHSAIYLLIAGTYTPFMLGALRGAWGWSLFGVIWGLALAGIVFKQFHTGRYPLLSTLVYLAMGWLIVIAAVPMLRLMPAAALVWLAAGGIAYTAGTPFYHRNRQPYAHAVWHVFVLAGSVCHGIAVGLQI